MRQKFWWVLYNYIVANGNKIILMCAYWSKTILEDHFFKLVKANERTNSLFNITLCKK